VFVDDDPGMAIPREETLRTQVVDRAIELSARIHTDTMAINSFGCQPCTPFGGVKGSGIGRGGGPEGLDAYLWSHSVLGV
jgi:acyl-CoA reductase-like NAD-dependent aldehyde dehydrogenase